MINSSGSIEIASKQDRIDIGIIQKHLIFNNSNKLKTINFRCIAFTKDELWVFNPEILKHDIIKFIKYTNSLRYKNLKSLPFSKGLQRTDLLDDFEKAVFFIQKFINEDENNDLDDNNS